MRSAPEPHHGCMELTEFATFELSVGLCGGVFGTWYFARQLYTAAMHDFVMTGVPETRHYREEHRALFRNNVIGAIAILPVVAAGAMVASLELLGRFTG